MDNLLKNFRHLASLMISLWMIAMMTIPALALETETAAETVNAAGGISLTMIGIIAAILVVIIIIAVLIKGSGKNKEIPEPAVMPKAGEYTIDDAPKGAAGEGEGETTKKTLETTLITEDHSEGAFLIRKKTEEKISIHVGDFRIGRDRRRVNYKIADNDAVDRLHCEIIKKEDGFYVKNHSESGTVSVGDVNVALNEESPLVDGDILEIADEAFEFHTGS